MLPGGRGRGLCTIPCQEQPLICPTLKIQAALREDANLADRKELPLLDCRVIHDDPNLLFASEKM